MGAFAWGLVIGWLIGLALLGLAAALLYHRLIQAERRAQHAERLAELGTLTGGLAHEIKNPLSTVQLNLQLLREDLPSDDPAYGRIAARLNTVQREAARLKDILDDFLRYAGKIELDRRPVDLHALLEELVDFFMPQAQLQRVQLRLKSPATPDGRLMAPVDARLVKQAVLNLMLNSMQALGENGGEVILAASRDGSDAVIEVIDTGRGIAPEALNRIFQAYYSTKSGGTGLGLAMAKRIVEEHGGRIRVKSEPGKGSDFSLHFPLE